MANLQGFRVAVIATDGFEEQELTEPIGVLKDVGAEVAILSPKSGDIQAFRRMDKSITVPVNRVLAEADPDEFDGVVLPGGGFNADFMRVLPELRSFLRS